jgi:hypothetical protein
LSPSSSPPPFCGIPLGIGGGAACVVIVSVGVEAAGGGGAAVVCVATTAALWDAPLGWACRLCFRAGLVVARVVVAADRVVVVAAVAVVVAVVVAVALAAVWVEVEVEADDPQALTNSVSATAIAGMRSVFIVISLPPKSVAWVRGRRTLAVASRT